MAPSSKRRSKRSTQCKLTCAIGKYAIGGAVGATLYLEPAASLEVHIFVTLPSAPGSSLLTLVPLDGDLEALGGTVQEEHIVVGGLATPVSSPPAMT